MILLEVDGSAQASIKRSMPYKILLLFLVILVGCTESTVELNTDRLGYHYFPLEVGDYRIYDVVETNVSILDSITSEYQLKEAIVDSSYTTSGDLFYRVHRSTRMSDLDVWELDSVWTAMRTVHLAMMVENNLNLVKLIFPIEDDLNWDGNSNNNRSFENYRSETQIADTTLFENDYIDLIKVIQSENENAVFRKNKSETYAPNVGLIIKSEEYFNYDQEAENQEINDGRSILMALRSYGKE